MVIFHSYVSLISLPDILAHFSKKRRVECVIRCGMSQIVQHRSCIEVFLQKESPFVYLSKRKAKVNNHPRINFQGPFIISCWVSFLRLLFFRHNNGEVRSSPGACLPMRHFSAFLPSDGFHISWAPRLLRYWIYLWIYFSIFLEVPRMTNRDTKSFFPTRHNSSESNTKMSGVYLASILKPDNDNQLQYLYSSCFSKCVFLVLLAATSMQEVFESFRYKSWKPPGWTQFHPRGIVRGHRISSPHSLTRQDDVPIWSGSFWWSRASF